MDWFKVSKLQWIEKLARNDMLRCLVFVFVFTEVPACPQGLEGEVDRDVPNLAWGDDDIDIFRCSWSLHFSSGEPQFFDLHPQCSFSSNTCIAEDCLGSNKSPNLVENFHILTDEIKSLG